MEMKKIILALTTVGLLTGCGSHVNDSSSDNVNTSTPTITESETTSQDASSSEETSVPSSSETTTEGTDTDTTPNIPEAESYKVNIRNDNAAVTLTSDKAKAKAGETVTITAKINNENYGLTNVRFDGNLCNKVNDTTYTFVMPDHPVFVTCTLAVIKGDVKLVGGVTAAFEREGDIYVARNVNIANDTQFDLIVSQDGHDKKMGITNFDRTKTFANIGFTSGNSDYDLSIDGGSTYDFFYDPSNGERPCYVVRTKVNQLPTSPDGLYKLFDGQIGMETSVLPRELLSTTFVNSLTGETLDWNRYQDNSSLSEISKVNMSGEKVVKSVVYNKIENDKLTVVDTFVPGNSDAYVNNNVLNSDKKVFSGEYKIAEAEEDGELTSAVEFRDNLNFVNPLIAQMCVDHSPITMEAYESDIMYAYRVGYQVEGDVTQANANVTSARNSDGSFTVKLVSSRTVDSTHDRTSNSGKVQAHYEYRVNFTFNQAGALLKSNYAEKSFSAGEYDFDRLKFVNGSVETNWENNGNIVKQLRIENTYGKPVKATSNFDASKYLVSEIRNISIVNNDINGHEGNRLNLGDRLQIDVDPKQSIVNFDVYPETALNKFQYRVVDSSNKEVIDKINGFWTAKNIGESDVSIGIINGLGVKASSKVNVYCTYKLRSVYLYNEYGKYDHQTGTNTGIIYTNNIMPYRIQVNESSRNKVVPMPRDMQATFVGENYGMTTVFDYDKQIMYVDATKTNAVGGETVKIKLVSAIYDPEWIRNDIIITLTVKPAISPDVLIGEWKITGEDADRCYFTKQLADPNQKGYSEDRPYVGRLVCLGVTYEFNWGFNPLANKILVRLVDEEYYHSLLDIIYDLDTDKLSIIFVIKKWTNPPTPDEEILGYEGDEGNNVYIDFERVGADNAQ